MDGGRVVSEQVYAITLEHVRETKMSSGGTKSSCSRAERFDVKEVAIASGECAQGTASCSSLLGTFTKRLPLWADLWSSVSSGIDHVAACQEQAGSFEGSRSPTRSRGARCGTRRTAAPYHCSLLTPAVQNRASFTLLNDCCCVLWTDRVNTPDKTC